MRDSVAFLLALVLTQVVGCRGCQKAQNENPATVPLPPPTDQPVTEQQAIPKQVGAWYRIILDPSKRLDPKEILSEVPTFSNLPANVDRFREAVVLDNSITLDSSGSSPTLPALSFETVLDATDSFSELSSRDRSHMLVVIENVDLANRRVLSSPLESGFREDFLTFTGLPVSKLEEFVPEEKLAALMKDHYVFPHCMISVPAAKGMSIAFLTITPSRYVRDESGSYQAVVLLPRLRIFGAQIVRDERLGNYDSWVAEGRSTEGETVEAYFDKDTGLLLLEVIETPTDRTIRVLWHSQPRMSR